MDHQLVEGDLQIVLVHDDLQIPGQRGDQDLLQLTDMHHLKRPRCTATGGQCAPMPDYLFPLDGTDGFLICSQKFNYIGSKY